MLFYRPTGLFLLVLIGLVLSLNDASGLIIYRLGTPFSAAQKDSLRDLDIDFIELDWTASESLKEVELDSLEAGVLQPDFFTADENIAATALGRGGLVTVLVSRHPKNGVGNVLLDEDPRTVYTWLEIAPESFNRQIVERVNLDLGGHYLVKEVRFRPLPEHTGHFVEHFTIGVSNSEVSNFRNPVFPVVVEVKENNNRGRRQKKA